MNERSKGSVKHVSEKRVHKIVNAKLSMHVKYPAPKGHKGLERVMARDKRVSKYMKTGK